MTHSFNTSVIKSRRHMSNEFYQVEIIDFDMESSFFEVMADNSTEANMKAMELAASDGIDIYTVNIYKL